MLKTAKLITFLLHVLIVLEANVCAYVQSAQWFMMDTCHLIWLRGMEPLEMLIEPPFLIAVTANKKLHPPFWQPNNKGVQKDTS